MASYVQQCRLARSPLLVTHRTCLLNDWRTVTTISQYNTLCWPCISFGRPCSLHAIHSSDDCVVCAGPSIWKPDIQMPIPEKAEAVITVEPYTYYKPAMEFHTKGVFVTAWQQAVVQHCAQMPSVPAAGHLGNTGRPAEQLCKARTKNTCRKVSQLCSCT